jgi:hypothetical protein
MKNDAEERAYAWVITVDMGLGHQRAAHPLLPLARNGIITAGSPGFADEREQRLWTRMRNSYEFVSRVKSVPLVGTPLFNVLDRLQTIQPLYPIRDQSRSTYQVRLVQKYIERGIAHGALEIARSEPLPLVSTHPFPALAADYAGMRRNYCVVTDAEIARPWVAENPQTSRIHYFAPCGRSVMRLRAYGVPDERIFLTGWPFPEEILGGENLSILKNDVALRLYRLDPGERFWPLHRRNVEHFLGRENCRFTRGRGGERTLTITYAVGGAGAQKEIGAQIAMSMRHLIKEGSVRLNLVAGIRPEVRDYFALVKAEAVGESDNLQILYEEDKTTYFDKFARLMRTTDILWTKPSELSFFAGLGLPIVMAPPLGSQELFNQKWLLEIQAGINQDDPNHAHEWVMDLLREGRFAESAWDGFLKARKYGFYKIKEILETGTMARETSPLKR